MLFEHPGERTFSHHAVWKARGAGWGWGLAGGAADPAEAELPATGPGRMKLNVKIKQQPSRRETKLIFGGENPCCRRFMNWKPICRSLSGLFSKPLQVPTSLALISLRASPTFCLTSGDDRIISDMFLLGFLVWLLLGHALQLFAGLLLEKPRFQEQHFWKSD